MIISGYKSINISTQDYGEILGGIRLENPFSNFSIGISGSNTYNLNISGSKILNESGKFLYGIPIESDIDFKIKFDPSGCIAYINDIPLDCKSGNFSSISYINLNGSGDADFSVFGRTPDLDLNIINYLVFNREMSGIIVNNTPDRIFKINSGDIVNSNIAGLSITGFTSGDISNSGVVRIVSNNENTTNSGEAEIILYTNFGDIQFPINFSVFQVPPDGYLKISPNENVNIVDGELKDFAIESYYNFGSRNLSVSLDLVSMGTPIGDPVQINDIWNLYTGILGGDLLNHNQSGWYTSGSISHSGSPAYIPIELINYNVARITYDNSLISGGSVARLSVNDSVNTIYSYISGF